MVSRQWGVTPNHHHRAISRWGDRDPQLLENRDKSLNKQKAKSKHERKDHSTGAATCEGKGQTPSCRGSARQTAESTTAETRAAQRWARKYQWRSVERHQSTGVRSVRPKRKRSGRLRGQTIGITMPKTQLPFKCPLPARLATSAILAHLQHEGISGANP